MFFFDGLYYQKFYNRNSPNQKLEPTQHESLSDRLNLTVPTGFLETGYNFHFVNDDDEWETSQWWFYIDKG